MNDGSYGDMITIATSTSTETAVKAVVFYHLVIGVSCAAGLIDLGTRQRRAMTAPNSPMHMSGSPKADPKHALVASAAVAALFVGRSRACAG